MAVVATRAACLVNALVVEATIASASCGTPAQIIATRRNGSVISNKHNCTGTHAKGKHLQR